jgi:hypothetical protein
MRSVPSVSMERNQALAISRPNVRTRRSPVLRRFDALVAIEPERNPFLFTLV